MCQYANTKVRKGDENLIAFMSALLKDVELKYPNVEKQAYALVKGVKKSRQYILRNKVFATVLDPIVKLLLMQSELGERRAKCVTMLQEYDIEIQPMKLVRGRTLTRTMAEIVPKITTQQYHLQYFLPDEWYDDVVFCFLNQKCPAHLNTVQRRVLRLKSASYMLKREILYKKIHEGIYLHCLGKEEAA